MPSQQFLIFFFADRFGNFLFNQFPVVQKRGKLGVGLLEVFVSVWLKVGKDGADPVNVSAGVLDCLHGRQNAAAS